MSDDRSRSFGSQMEENVSKVICLLERLPPKVKDFNWALQNEFSKSLNPRKESGCDWRTVASRLGFSKIIPQLEKKENPTIALFKECAEAPTEMLLGILVDIERSDVLDDILKVDYPKSSAKFSTQESHKGSDSCASSLSWPLQYSGNETSSDETGASRGRLGAQESEEAGEAIEVDCSIQGNLNRNDSGVSSLSCPLQERLSIQTSSDSFSDGTGASSERLGYQDSNESEEYFLPGESETFWVNIPGDYEQKNLIDFILAAKDQCPTEMQQENMEKFLCGILEIDYGQLDINDSYVTLNSFLELVARFGPFKPGPDGCLQKMYDLMTNSLSKRQGKEESWFAGNMDETEAANLLSDQSPGHFLIRISYFRAFEGVFVLAVKTRDNGVVQIQIERDLHDNTLLLADQKFPDLMSIVEALRDDVLLENCSQLLTYPCPGLPLNALFTGY
ncbi:uncharacterized protein [Acropora muricata]|uniref:uncharacterized protein n=1 Tax=Acropora muricata TaxID=159855 RepID=UPI0034E576F6